jgi:hypothetical protein
MLNLAHAVWSFSTTEPATVFPSGREPRTCQHLAMSGAYIYILGIHTSTLYWGWEMITVHEKMYP